MSSILCVDDDIFLADLLRYALTREGFNVQIVHTGAEAIRFVRATTPDVVVLDVNLPDMDGYTLCAYFRNTAHVPVLMLTARGTDEDALVGFGQGADDYMAKPFNMQLLIYRLRALLRRGQADPPPGEESPMTYRLGDGLFSPHHNEIIGAHQRIVVTRTEGRILHLLLVHEGQVLSAEQIVDRVWGHDSDRSYSVVKTHIRHLREKLEAALGDPHMLQTVPGIGYMLRQVGASMAQPIDIDVDDDAGDDLGDDL